MSNADSTNDDDFLSARGSNDFTRSQVGERNVWDEESTDDGPSYTAVQSLHGGVEREAWRGEADEEDAPVIAGVGQEVEPAVARVEVLEGLILLNAEGAPTPAYPTVISDATDALRVVEDPRDTGTVISWVAFEPPLQEPINVDVGPRTTTNEIAQPTGGGRLSAIIFDGTAINNRSEREEADPAPRSDRPGDAQPLPRHKKSKKRRKNGKPSSKQEHCGGHSRRYVTSSMATSSQQTERPLEVPVSRASGRNRRNGPRRRDETPPLSTSSRSRNRSRDHTGSTVRSDSGPGSPRFVIRTPRIDSNESQLYKGFCWGWKPSWWPESWRWPDTVT